MIRGSWLKTRNENENKLIIYDGEKEVLGAVSVFFDGEYIIREIKELSDISHIEFLVYIELALRMLIRRGYNKGAFRQYLSLEVKEFIDKGLLKRLAFTEDKEGYLFHEGDIGGC